MKAGLYPYKHFLTTIILGPALVFAQELRPVNLANMWDTYSAYLLFLMFGFVFALPAFVVYLLVYRLLIKRPVSFALIKIILNCIAIVGLFITMKLIGGSLTNEIIVAYVIAIVISSLFYRIGKQKTNAENETK
jgi:hypothetical protein